MASEPEAEDRPLSEEELEAALREGLRLFDEARYKDAHESFERCWLSTHGPDSDFYKGLIQASICMHHFWEGNLAGARKLYAGHRGLLGPYLPSHRGVDVARVLAEMQRALGPALRAGDEVGFRFEDRPRSSPGSESS